MDNKEIIYSGYGFNNRGSGSLLSLIFKNQRFFIHENIDVSLVGLSIGNRIVKKNGAEPEKSPSAGIMIGYNLGICGGFVLEDEKISVGANYTLFGGSYITDLEYDLNISNKGLLELRGQYDHFMVQGGFSLNKNVKMWNAMATIWLGEDPLDGDNLLGLFIKAENNKTLSSTNSAYYDKYNVYSIGITLLY